MAYRDWSTQRLICREILQGRAEAVFVAYDIALADQAIYRRLADEALSRPISRRSAAKRYFRATIKNPIWISTMLSSLVGAISFAVAVVLTRWIDLSRSSTFPMLSAVAGFSAIGVAAMGWGVSGWIAHRNNRSKYTLDTVAARFAQSAFTDALALFNKRFRDVTITDAMVADLAASPHDEDRQAVQGQRYLLNYFEFIAVGVLEGELDERIVARTLRGNLADIYDRSMLYVIELQRKNPRTLEHFSRLRRHYEEM